MNSGVSQDHLEQTRSYPMHTTDLCLGHENHYEEYTESKMLSLSYFIRISTTESPDLYFI